MSEPRLQLLLSDPDSGPTVPEGLSAELLQAAPAPSSAKKMAFRASILHAAHDLASQKWALIAPDPSIPNLRRKGSDLVRWVERLVSHRAAQQGCPVRPPYFVPPNMDTEDAALWYETQYMKEPDPLQRPRYLLILGDLDEVSFELQMFLGSLDLFVGRLTFETEAQFRTYVDKVIHWEQPRTQPVVGQSWLWGVRDGSKATRLGEQGLLEPLELRCKNSSYPYLTAPRRHPQSLDPPSRDSFLRTTKTDVPTFLLSLSHGAGKSVSAWGGVTKQRECQGGLYFGPQEVLYAEDVATDPFLPGGFWFYFACFGAGTPRVSTYSHWMKVLLAGSGTQSEDIKRQLEAIQRVIPPDSSVGGRPFIAALPQAVLSNPEGPLGVIGHVDLAWSYSFGDKFGEQSASFHLSRFADTIGSLAQATRIGLAFRSLLDHLSAINTQLLAKYDAEAANAKEGLVIKRDPTERTRLWMLRQDLGSYILLGDPAAPFPIGAPTPSAIYSSNEPSSPEEISRRERAVLALLASPTTPDQIAAHFGVDPATLGGWSAAYTAAGRAALAGLIRSPTK